MPYGLLLSVLLFFQLETLAYLAVNGISSRLRSVPLLTEADAAIPARPGSLWLYLSFVPYCLMAVLDLRSLRRTMRVLACVGLEAAVSYRCFLKFPSRYPRPALGGQDALGEAWQALHQADRPGNTFPSIHVGHSLLLALLLSHHLPRERADALLLWAALISASTLTTKQHYLVDLAGGVVAAEAIASHVYEPWVEGRLRWRDALREVRRLCERLDALARAPGGCRLRACERHPRLREFLARLAAHGDLSALYASSRGRGRILARSRRLARMLRRAGPALSILTRVTPGWLQFARQFQRVSPGLSDRRVASYLEEHEADLRRALELVFEHEPATSPAVVSAPAA